MTVHAQVISILKMNGYKETSYPGKYGRDDRADYVYLGKRHSVRIGKTKALSRPISPLRLQKLLPSLPSIEPKVIDRSLPIARKKLHDWVQTLDLEQCQELQRCLDNDTDFGWLRPRETGKHP